MVVLAIRRDSRVPWPQPNQQPLLVSASTFPFGELSLIDALYHLEDETGQLPID
jgi:hypothetical protein